MDEIPILWIAAPLTGLIVQPIVGYLSDRTWTRPRAGAGRTSCSARCWRRWRCSSMPNSPALWIAAGMLWMLDASINVSMEPFRAFVGDQLPPRAAARRLCDAELLHRRRLGGRQPAAVAARKVGVGNTAGPGEMPDTVRYAFYFGGVVLLLAVVLDGLRTREYPPEQLKALRRCARRSPRRHVDRGRARRHRRRRGLARSAWRGAGARSRGSRWTSSSTCWRGLIAAYGAGAADRALARAAHGMFASIMRDLHDMPTTMRQLAVVQFFSWFALFAMWIYTTAAVTSVHFGSSDPTLGRLQRRRELGRRAVRGLQRLRRARGHGDPVDGARAWACALTPPGQRRASAASACCRSLLIRDPQWLLLSMVGVGFAWASILSLPYALLSDSAAGARRWACYMGIFNFFIVIPQLVAASVLGFLLKHFFGGEADPGAGDRRHQPDRGGPVRVAGTRRAMEPAAACR